MNASSQFIHLLEVKLNQFIVSPRGVKVHYQCASIVNGNKVLTTPVSYQVLVAELVALDIKKNYKYLSSAISLNGPCIIDFKTVMLSFGNVDSGLQSNRWLS
jgi:hypothetical protein